MKKFCSKGCHGKKESPENRKSFTIPGLVLYGID